MARRICLAIGVSTVMPPGANQAARFANLDGAIVAARAIGDWARGAGFGAENVQIVDDGQVDGQANPVTRERVQQAVDALLPAGAEIVDHMLLAFCGHGMTDANPNSVSWLLSDSLRMRYRVVADSFYVELLRAGIQRITLISDACREAPKGLDLTRLEPQRGITVDGNQVDSPLFDRFTACQDGQLGYMVSDATSALPGKCIFSGVIADVLWGREAAAIKDGIITTATFGDVVRSRTTERAKDYGLKLSPQCSVDPRPAVLYDEAKPFKWTPALQPWPPAGAAASMGPVAEGVQPADDADLNLEKVNTNIGFRNEVLGPDFGSDLHELNVSKQTLAIPKSSKDVLQRIVVLRTALPGGSDPEAETSGASQPVRSLVQRLEADIVADTRNRAAQDVRRSLAQIKPSGPDGSNLIVWGSGATPWSRGPVERRKQTSARIGFRVGSDPAGTPVLVQLADGAFTPVVPYERLYAVVKRSNAGDVFQAYGEHDSRKAFQSALKAIADFATGQLDVDRIDELAGQLRLNKHADPAMGVICAYLYRAIADFDSIRRMAYFYVVHHQPVPFDIALLGSMEVTRDGDGSLRLHVPAVKARPPRDGDDALPRFVITATPEVQGSIGGRCPWLGLGWDYVGMPRPEWAVLVEGLGAYASDIRRSGFTLLPDEIGRALAEVWRLQPR